MDYKTSTMWKSGVSKENLEALASVLETHAYRAEQSLENGLEDRAKEELQKGNRALKAKYAWMKNQDLDYNNLESLVKEETSSDGSINQTGEKVQGLLDRETAGYDDSNRTTVDLEEGYKTEELVNELEAQTLKTPSERLRRAEEKYIEIWREIRAENSEAPAPSGLKQPL